MAINQFSGYVKSQVLADSLTITEDVHSTEIEVNEETVTIDVKKI